MVSPSSWEFLTHSKGGHTDPWFSVWHSWDLEQICSWWWKCSACPEVAEQVAVKLLSPGCYGCQKIKWVQVKAVQVHRRKIHWDLSNAKRKHLWLQKVSLRHKLFSTDIWREFLLSLLILLPKHQLLATARDGIWGRRTFGCCTEASMMLHFSRFLSPPGLYPLNSQKVSTTSAKLGAAWLSFDWGNENDSCGEKWWKSLP